MPYKLKDAVRHKFARAKYRVKNWREYNESLKNRVASLLGFQMKLTCLELSEQDQETWRQATLSLWFN